MEPSKFVSWNFQAKFQEFPYDFLVRELDQQQHPIQLLEQHQGGREEVGQNDVVFFGGEWGFLEGTRFLVACDLAY